MASSSYEVLIADAGRDAGRVVGVWRGNLAQSKGLEEKFEWFYRQCPWGSPLVRLLRHVPSGEFVGVASAGPRVMHCRGGQMRAGVLVDMAVHTEHRSLYPAVLLQKAVMADGLAGFDLVYGFPNPKAAAVFKRVGYQCLGEIVRYAAVVRGEHYLARHMPVALARVAGALADLGISAWRGLRGMVDAYHASWCERADARMDALWTSAPVSGALVTERSSQFLNWRFDSAPGPKYRYYCVTDRGKKRLLAWFACAPQDRALHVADFWSVDGDAGLQTAFLRALLREARRSGFASVSMEFMGSDAIVRSLRAEGFAPRGSRPVYYALAPSVAPDAIGRWHLTSADEDE